LVTIVLIAENSSLILYSLLFSDLGVLVANKTDLKQRRVISMKQGKELASAHGLEYFETSAVSI
jgi:hypothetical protein